ncbi:carbohydrate ABC transporter ATP-binding protein, CUT1 family [Aliiroseovarius halocynthiae]|uniref:ABC transporter ATP-binding protein n=1 Tax=Aliiroseovarius halocynthiae TaxID=985055 RepID=A0A545SVT5_9RHOB|nr:ABC transporter ATP-binding protein [Aliiroseovarius halocynthiae]TQV69059.1 ABC transporter ATP-binding protein [Aliiroseovarius halocynthiae]SMR71812.1 carbohydrate ABC transporter ATP-binding protein, CUT1 family [Aliiroseovarius halocynthiae]
MAELSIENIAKRFGETEVLKGISIDISDGEFVSLVGPSGCGKSTLLRIIAGLEEQSSGDIRISGQSVAGQRAADRNLSMVFQSYALYPHLSVGENIAVPLKMRRMTGLQRLPLLGNIMPGAREARGTIEQDVSHAAQILEIGHLLDRKPGQLSGGQRQRVALGRALVRNPAAFLLDEPLSNLDAKLRVQTRAEIAQLHRQLDATFIYVTHDQVEAMTMSDRIAVMMGGRILQCAAPDVVYEDPDRIEVAEFIGSPKINILPVEVSGEGRLSLLDQPLNLAVPGANRGVASLGLRPEALRLSGEGAPIHGHVVHSENLGSELYVQVEVTGLEEQVTLRTMPDRRSALTLGTPVALDFDAAKALVFDADGARLRKLRNLSATTSEVA